MQLPDALSADYVPSPDGTFYIRPGATDDFWYSDGAATQARLLEVVRQARDLSSGSFELAAMAYDWPSLYHLTHERQNLLRPLADRIAPRGGAVLEIGAGCGAITRFLGELGRDRGFAVLALEGSPARAAVAAARCRDLTNVYVVADAIERFTLPGPFAAATLIGVLEYARVIMPRADGVDWLLKRVAGLVAGDGVLITAIENQMGLKYLAGAPEDHLGQPFFGINDAYGPGQPVTFGRRELDARLRRAGFAANRFLYPFPDYKLPTMIVTEAGATVREPDLGPLFHTMAAPALGTPYLRLFSEERAWGVVHRNGLLRDLANAFLVVSARDGQAPGEPDPEAEDVLCHIYSTARARPYAKHTAMLHDENGTRFERRSLHPEAPQVAGPFSQRLKTEALIPGQLYAIPAVALLNRPDWTVSDLAGWYAPFAAELCRRARVSPAEAPARGLMRLTLPKNMVDAGPGNAIRQEDGAFRFFDLEWIAASPPPLGFVMLRGLLTLFGRLHSVAQGRQGREWSLLDLATAVLAGTGFPLLQGEVEEALFLETRLQTVATGVDAREAVLRKARLSPLFQRPRALIDCWLKARQG